MRSFCVFIFTFITFQQINSQGIEYVQRINDAAPKSADGLAIYSLPRTVVAVKVNFSHTNTINGPYSNFAKELLGISSVPTAPSSTWKIDSIAIHSFSEPDPAQMFIIKTAKGFKPGTLFDFTSNGIILNPSKSDFFYSKNSTDNICEALNDKTDMSEILMKSSNFEANDTVYKMVVKDSILMKVPIIKTKTEAKTIKDRAIEAAEVIFKIRQRRFEMIMAEDEALPEEKALRVALNEMQKIEDAYLALFIGRSSTQKTSSWFYYTPKEAANETNIELFRFSAKVGVADKTDPLASPVFISLTKENRTAAIAEYVSLIPHAGKNYIYYRIPDVARVTLNCDNEILYSKNISVLQYGVVMPYAAFTEK